MMLKPEGRNQNREFGRASAGSCEVMSWTILLPSPNSLWLAPLAITRSLGVSVSISLLAISAGSALGVLVLAGYSGSAMVGIDLGPFSAGIMALAVFGEIARRGLQARSR